MLPSAAAAALLLAASAAPPAVYHVSVVNRSLTGAPLLEHNRTSWAPNTLNPSWLPLPGNEGGGLFFRVMAPFDGVPGSPYNAVGFVQAASSDGLSFPRVTAADVLRDGPPSHPIADAADPRAVARPATGEYLVAYQIGTAEYPGRHTQLSRTRTPHELRSWRRDAKPMFAGVKAKDGVSPLLEAVSLRNCTSQLDQSWRVSGGDTPAVIRYGGRADRCLSIQESVEVTGGGNIGVAPCSAATKWIYSKTRQLMVANTSGGAFNGQCLDVDHGQGPDVGLYACHAVGSRDFVHQQWAAEGGGLLRSVSAAGRKCAALGVMTPQDCGTAVFFPEDTSTATGTAYAIATFGELRGGNLTLVSSTDLQEWKLEGTVLTTRWGHWDNATLSTGPSPVRLSDGNWLLLYDVDNLWPVQDPQPLPAWGRCALGWAVLDQRNLTRVLARAEEPLVHAELPWETGGATAGVVYTGESDR